MKAASHMRSQKSRGFSLTELLVVCAILGILAVVTAPAISSIKKGTDLQSSASRLIEQLQMARQAARSGNFPVEVRIYPQTTAVDSAVAVQSYSISETGVRSPREKIQYLPNSIDMSVDGTNSTLVSNAASVNDPARGNRAYYSLVFLPNGSLVFPNHIELPKRSPTITLLLRAENKGGALPANFYTIQIDLQTGRPRTFRPS